MSFFGDIFDFGKDLIGGVLGGAGNSVGGNLVSGLVGGGMDIAAVNAQNKANKEMATTAQDFSAEQAGLGRKFIAGQSEIGRDWQEDMFGKAMRFNSAQTAKQYTRERKMRANQYQVAMKDMKKAGLNPMLAYSQGGAGTPSTSAASAGSAGGAPGGGSAPVGQAQTYHVKGYGGALQSAYQMARIQTELDKLQGENKLIHAQAANTEAVTERTKQETQTSAASAGQLYASTRELKARIGQIKQEIAHSKQDANTKFAQQALYEAERNLTRRKETNAEIQADLLRIERTLQGNLIPASRAEAAAASTWYGQKIRPFLPDVVKGAATAAGTAYGAKELFKPRALRRKADRNYKEHFKP